MTLLKFSSKKKEQIIQNLNFRYIGRHLKKRNFRKLWIYRIKAASLLCNSSYSKFLGTLRKEKIFFNKKILAFFAFNDLLSFITISKEIVNASYTNWFFLTSNKF